MGVPTLFWRFGFKQAEWSKKRVECPWKNRGKRLPNDVGVIRCVLISEAATPWIVFPLISVQQTSENKPFLFHPFPSFLETIG